jgi:NAD(P)-dependent dehydrogenase (short-subunit alcohol dehydrogenase family)
VGDARTVVITGANTGIGKATAAALAAQGFHLVLACRSADKTRPVIDELVRTTGNHDIEHLPLDLADLSSVRRAADELLAADRPLHVLINNAGLAGERGQQTVDGFELTFGVNHLGHFLLTTLLLDRIAASAPARIVNVSSSNHFNAKGIDWDALQEPTRTRIGLHEYDVSKLCNVLFTQQLASRFDPATIAALAVNPGPVASDIWRRMPAPLYALFKFVRRLKSIEEGAKPSLRAATDPECQLMSGAYLEQDGIETPASARATPELGRELWRRSEAWVTQA